MDTLGMILGVVFGILFYVYILTYITLGFAQPIAAICRLLAAERLDSAYAIGLKKYLLAVVLYFLVLFGAMGSGLFYNAPTINMLYLFVLPWAYAIWYIRHIRAWKKKLKNIAEFDNQQLLNAPHEDRVLLDSFPKKKVHLKHPFANRNTQNRNSHKTIIRSLPTLKRAY